MNFIKTIAFGSLLILTIVSRSKAQSYGEYFPEIGKPLMDFTLTELVNYPKKTASLKDFKGKWLILDIWGYSCGACIASFPKMDSLSEQFKDKVKVVMVGATKSRSNRSEKAISTISKRLYYKKERKHGLRFTVAFDSVMYLQYNVEPLPYILLIDPEGIVRAKAQSLSSEQLTSFLNGKVPLYERQYSRGEKTPADLYKKSIPLLTNGSLANGGIDSAFIYRSLLCKWNPEQAPWISRSDLGLDEFGELKLAGYPLIDLIQFAYTNTTEWTPDNSLYGKFSQKLILEIKDSSMFTINYRNKYAYSVVNKRRTLSSSDLQRILQNDIQNAFGFKISVEKRMMPVWNLVVSDIKALEARKTNGGEFSGLEFGYQEGFSWKNISIKRLAQMDLWTGVMGKAYHLDKFHVPPVIDATGLDWTIDMDFKADMEDFVEMKAALNRNGLDLVPGETEMSVIVVRENK